MYLNLHLAAPAWSAGARIGEAAHLPNAKPSRPAVRRRAAQRIGDAALTIFRRHLGAPLCLAVCALPLSTEAATMDTATTCGPTVVLQSTVSGQTGMGPAFTQCETVTTTEAITEVLLTGGSGPDQLFAYPDLTSAPGPAMETRALRDALGFFGITETVTSTALSLIESLTGPITLVREVSQNPGTTFIGPPELAEPGYPLDDTLVLTGQLTVTDTAIFSVTNSHRLTATLSAPVVQPDPPGTPIAPVPLPATFWLLGFGLLPLLALRRRTWVGVSLSMVAAALAVAPAAQAATMDSDTTCSATDFRLSSQGGILAITNCETVTTVEAIIEVVLTSNDPDRLFTYPDATNAPGPGEAQTALDDALAFHGLSGLYPDAVLDLALIDRRETSDGEVVSVTEEPGTISIGTVNDPLNIEVILGQVNVRFTEFSTVTNGYRLTAALGAPQGGADPGPVLAPVQLPATVWLLACGLFPFLALRRRVRV